MSEDLAQSGRQHGPLGTQDAGSFAFFSLQGERFDAPGMPADTVTEVSHFRGVVLAMARQLWLSRHPGRRRVPNGFLEAFDLRLVGVVDSGSAGPNLVLNRPRGSDLAQGDWEEWSELYAQARDAVTGAFQTPHNTDDGGPLQLAVLPVPVVRSLRRLGSTLTVAESLTFGSPGPTGARAVVDYSVRRALLEIDEVLPPSTESVELEGVITEYDSASMTFRLRTDGGTAVCRLEEYNDELGEKVRRALALDGITAPDVRVLGQALDINRHPLQLFNVHSVEVIRSLGEKLAVERVRSLGRLSDGWRGPGSAGPSSDVLKRAEVVAPRITAVVGQAIIVPTEDGAVAMEWQRGPVAYSVAIEADNQMFLLMDDTQSDALEEQELIFDLAVIDSFVRTGQMP